MPSKNEPTSTEGELDRKGRKKGRVITYEGEGKPFTKSLTPNRGPDYPASLSTQPEASKPKEPTESQPPQKSEQTNQSDRTRDG